MKFHPRRFDRAAATYGAHSGFQDAMADRLAALLPPEAAPGRVLEIGCGTGHLTRRLRACLPEGDVLVTDAAPRMLAAARAALDRDGGAEAARVGARRGATAFALFDAEGEAGIPDEVRAAAPFYLAAGNALVQWFPDLGAHLRMMAGLLGSGGSYLVSGFQPDNFPELNAILREKPFNYADFPGHDRDAVARAAAGAGFEIRRWEEESREVGYASAREFLEVIRSLGSARRPEPGHSLTRGKLAHLEQTYQERYGNARGIRATWRPWYARLVKT